MRFSKLILIDTNIRNLNWESYAYYQFTSRRTFVNYSKENRSLYKFTKLSKDFIVKFNNKDSWYFISVYQNLSENFMREFQNNISWYFISACQKLSENFIREFQNEVDWRWISRRQKLSREFIIKFIDRIDVMNLKNNKYVSKKDKDYIAKLKV